MNNLKNEFHSQEEKYFSWMLDELKAKGYIVEWQKCNTSLQLTKGLYLEYVKPMKKVANKVLKQTILEPSVYTPDFEITWAVKAFGIFVTDLDIKSDDKLDTVFTSHGVKSVVEVKGSWDNNNMTRLAKNNIKFVYDKHGIYINLIVVPNVFSKLFTPERYFMTDRTFKPRTLNYKNARTLREFIASLHQ